MRKKTTKLRPPLARAQRRFKKTVSSKATMPSLPLEIKSLLREVLVAHDLTDPSST